MAGGSVEPESVNVETAVDDRAIAATVDASAEIAPDAASEGAVFSLPRALAVAGLARLLTVVVAGLAVTLFGVNPASWALRFPRKAEVFRGILGNFLNPWAHWDGVWFIKIATDGYADKGGSVAFFPLFPLALRWIGVAFANNLVVAGIVFSILLPMLRLSSFAH